jgi:chromosome segregation ATPase
MLSGELEDEQGKVIKLEKETEELKLRNKTLELRLEEERKEKEAMEVNYTKVRNEHDETLKEYTKSQKQSLKLKETVDKLAKENSALSHAAEILKTVTGQYKTVEYIKHVRKTEAVETQAKEFYELCLALLQKVDNFKKTLTEVLIHIKSNSTD